MATKVYDSPTMNLFALLADEHASDSQAKKATKATPSKGPQQELTPKERAEAKAVQDAERKAKREEKAKQEAEAERRKKALEMIDDTGFSQQRHQRLKEIRQQERNPEPPTKSNKGKDSWGEKSNKSKDWGEEPKNKGESKAKSTPKGDWNKGFQTKSTDSKDSEGKAAATTDKTFTNKDKGAVKGDGKGNFKGGDVKTNKGNFKGDGGKGKDGNSAAKGPRSYDKHSQGVTSRKFQPKKQGHGPGNWDDAVPQGLSGGNVQDAVNSESLAAPAGTEVDGWGDTPSSPAPTEGGASPAPVVPADAGSDKKKEDESDEEEKKKRSYDDYLKDRAEKQAALEAVVGKINQPRQLSEEEKKALTKFTLVENTKAPVKKPENKAVPKPAAPTTTTTTTGPVGGARKGEKSVSLDSVLDVRVAGARTGRKGPRPEGGAPRDNAGRGPRKGGRGPQKILQGKNQFPDLPK